MKVDRAVMVELRKLARDYCGGYKHVLEVQTWDDKIDCGGMTEAEEDAADIGTIDLIEGVEIPDNAEQIDIQVWGTMYRGDDFGEHGTKLGYFYVATKDGKIVKDWQ